MIRLFEEIRDAFPRLSVRLDQEPRHVDLNIDIPQQPGLTFDVNLNLQGDELHLSAGFLARMVSLHTAGCRPDVPRGDSRPAQRCLPDSRALPRRQTVQGGAPKAGRRGLPDDRDLARVGLAVSATHCREGRLERDYAFVRRLTWRSKAAPVVARSPGSRVQRVEVFRRATSRIFRSKSSMNSGYLSASSTLTTST